MHILIIKERKKLLFVGSFRHSRGVYRLSKRTECMFSLQRNIRWKSSNGWKSVWSAAPAACREPLSGPSPATLTSCAFCNGKRHRRITCLHSPRFVPLLYAPWSIPWVSHFFSSPYFSHSERNQLFLLQESRKIPRSGKNLLALFCN